MIEKGAEAIKKAFLLKTVLFFIQYIQRLWVQKFNKYEELNKSHEIFEKTRSIKYFRIIYFQRKSIITERRPIRTIIKQNNLSSITKRTNTMKTTTKTGENENYSKNAREESIEAIRNISYFLKTLFLL